MDLFLLLFFVFLRLLPHHSSSSLIIAQIIATNPSATMSPTNTTMPTNAAISEPHSYDCFDCVNDNTNNTPPTKCKHPNPCNQSRYMFSNDWVIGMAINSVEEFHSYNSFHKSTIRCTPACPKYLSTFAHTAFSTTSFLLFPCKLSKHRICTVFHALLLSHLHSQPFILIRQLSTHQPRDNNENDIPLG
jgi:hypothetical protein